MKCLTLNETCFNQNITAKVPFRNASTNVYFRILIGCKAPVINLFDYISKVYSINKRLKKTQKSQNPGENRSCHIEKHTTPEFCLHISPD